MTTRKQYSHYFLESRLHFRIHAIRLQLSTALNSSSDSGSVAETGGLEDGGDMVGASCQEVASLDIGDEGGLEESL